MKFVATIEARMTSSRLPGKVLLEAAGKPMLGHLFDRLRHVPALDDIVLATTMNAVDNALVEYAESCGVTVYRGSEEDVLQRVVDAAASVGADVIVEITADCPIIDSGIISQCIAMYKAHTCDYLSNVCIRSYPDGMDTQVFSLKLLQETAQLTQDRLDHEHVSLYIRNHPEIYRQIHLIAPDQLHWPELGLTLDEKSDYELIKKIIEHFHKINHPLFSCYDVVSLLSAHPEWVQLNADVKRKGNT